MSIYPLIYTVIIIYRLLSDDEAGRRSMLYLHNVSTGLYGTSIFIYSIILMICVSIICCLILLGSDTVAKSLYFYVIIGYLVSGISCATFSICISMIIHVKYFFILLCFMFRMLAIILNIIINAVGFFLYDSSAYFACIPGY